MIPAISPWLISSLRGEGLLPTDDIEYINVNTGNGTSQNIPESEAGDFAICAAMRISNGTIPSIPDIDPDWLTPSGVNIAASHSGTCGGVLVYQFRPAAGTEDARGSGTFTNAQRIIAPLYRGAGSIIASAWASGSGETINIPGLIYSSSTARIALAYSHGGTTPATPPIGWSARAITPTRSYLDSGEPMAAFSGTTAALHDGVVSWIACAFAIDIA